MTVTPQTTLSADDLILDKMNEASENVYSYTNNGVKGMRSFNSPSSFALMLKNVPDTDLDAAKLVRKLFGNTITYVTTSSSGGEWYFWNGTVHQLATTNNIDDLIAQGIAELLGNVRDIYIANATKANLGDTKLAQVKAMMKDVLDYGKKIKGAAGLARLRERIRYEFIAAKDHFDHDTDFIVLSDGRVLLTNNITAAPLDPDPSRPVTNKMSVTFGGTDAKPGTWADFLNRLGLAADDQKYLQLMAGAALLGRADARNIAALVGLGGTGKTTYAMTVFKAFGSYAGNLPAGAIVDKGSVNFDQYKARGKRFILLEEPQEKRTDDSFLKNLAGAGGLVPTQEKGKNGVEWKPQGVLHITANHVPKINTQDDAIVERMNIVGFNVKGPKILDDEDATGPRLSDAADIHMRDCSNEIFEWIMAGAIEYDKTRKVVLSESIKNAAKVNVANGSVVIRWLLEQCEWADEKTPPRWEMGATTVHSKMVETSKEEYFNFNMWCMNNNEKVVSKASWAAEINRYMGEPDDKKGKRPGGSPRLWGISERDNTQINAAIALGNQSAAFTQFGTNRVIMHKS